MVKMLQHANPPRPTGWAGNTLREKLLGVICVIRGGHLPKHVFTNVSSKGMTDFYVCERCKQMGFIT